MLKIKNLILLFIQTMQSYGFSADKMYILLQELRDHYNEVLMKKWVVKFRDIFEADNYHPIQVFICFHWHYKKFSLDVYSAFLFVGDNSTGIRLIS